MKYLLKWRMLTPPSDKVRPTRMKDNEERQDEKKYGKVLYPAHMVGNLKGFTIVECDMDQLTNRLTLTPWLEYEVIPIFPSQQLYNPET